MYSKSSHNASPHESLAFQYSCRDQYSTRHVLFHTRRQDWYWWGVEILQAVEVSRAGVFAAVSVQVVGPQAQRRSPCWPD